MARCEDYPCCGCGPEGCIDRETVVICGDCGKRYHPDQNTEEFCYACQSRSGDGDEYDPEWD